MLSTSTVTVISSDPYARISLLISLVSLTLSLGTIIVGLIYNYLRKIKLSLMVENHLDLNQGGNPQMQLDDGPSKGKMELRQTTGFSVLVTILAKGPVNKWEIVKFESADVKVPDGKSFKFRCGAYLEDNPVIGRPKTSRNIVIPIQGDSTKNVTSRYQSSDFSEWVEGNYEISINVIDSKERIVKSNFKFSLKEKNILIIKEGSKIGASLSLDF